MERPYCSYWLNITGGQEDIDLATSKMEDLDLIGNPFTPSDEDSGEAAFEVEDGTVEQIGDIDELIAQVAAAAPKTVITLEEIDEDGHNFHRLLTFENGALNPEKTRYGRQLGPLETDSETISACIAVLKAAGMMDAVTLLEKEEVKII